MAGIIFSEGSGVNDSVFGKCQTPVKMFIEKKAEAYENASAVDKIFSKSKSNHFGETITSMTSMNGFAPVAEGGAYPKADMQESYKKTLVHTTFKSSFAITQEMVEDAKTMDLRKRPAAFLADYYRMRERFGACMIGAAVGGAKQAQFGGKLFDATSADGVAMFSTEHPSITNSTGVQSNRFTNAFSNDSLARAEAAMQNAKDDNGNILAVIPDTIIIPNIAELKADVFATIGADKDPDTANNGFNFTFGRWRVIVWAYLNQFVKAGTLPWILASSQYNEDYGGAVWFDRVPLSIKSVIDDNTDDNVWKGRARLSAGFHDWRAFAVGGVEDGTTLV